MISKGYLSNIRMASFGKHESYGFGFAVRGNDTRLLEAINATLNQISIAEQAAISKRWSAGSDLYLTEHKIQLTAREKRWLARHPVVRAIGRASFRARVCQYV